MVKIRLRRTGAKKQPHYRVVVADARSPRDGKFIEIIGNYNPRTEPPTMEVDVDRALYWLSVGAQPSAAVERMLDKLGILARAAAIKRGEELPEVEPGADALEAAAEAIRAETAWEEVVVPELEEADVLDEFAVEDEDDELVDEEADEADDEDLVEFDDDDLDEDLLDDDEDEDEPDDLELEEVDDEEVDDLDDSEVDLEDDDVDED